MFAKKSIFQMFLILLVVLMMSSTASAHPLDAPLGTGFTYQGKLSDGGSPANGIYDFQFTLYDALTSGNQVGSTVAQSSVTVTDGLFTVQLDFGAVFNGTALYLEIGVRPGGSSGAYTTLAPRQLLSATPYALFASNAALLNGLNSASFALASHTHWGETWSGSGTGLTLSGGTIGLSGSGDTSGVSGTSTSGNGVSGTTNSSSSYGVSGTNSSTSGYGVGVYGIGYNGIEGVGTSSTGGTAILGLSNGSNSSAGIFWGNVQVAGNLNVYGNQAASGTKSAVVNTQDYGTRTLYTVESPENWFQDFGTGQLTNGEAVITIDPVFAETVNLTEDYHVFLTPNGDCALYVDGKTPTSFTVHALGGQTCSIAFDYNIVAKRLGYEDVRLAEATDTPPAVELPNK